MALPPATESRPFDQTKKHSHELHRIHLDCALPTDGASTTWTTNWSLQQLSLATRNSTFPTAAPWRQSHSAWPQQRMLFDAPLKTGDRMTFRSFTFPLPTLHRLRPKSYAESNFKSSPMDVFQPVAKVRRSTWQLNCVLQLEPNGVNYNVYFGTTNGANSDSQSTSHEPLKSHWIS